MSPKTRNIIAWILQGLLGVAFIAAGAGKLLNMDKTIHSFGDIGLPAWFAWFIGIAEVLGGIGLLVRRTVRPAALCLMTIMVGAFVMHATRIKDGLSHSAPVLVLFVLLGLLFWLRNPGPDPIEEEE